LPKGDSLAHSITFASIEKQKLKSFLIIQTAFLGDVILATPLIEKLHQFYPDAKIDFLIRNGNEGLFEDHPFINKVLIWNKEQNKTKNLFSLLKQVRKIKYDYVINLQRFVSTGFLTAFSNSKCKIGFNKNPFSFLFTNKIKHVIGTLSHPKHECERNLDTIQPLTDSKFIKPRLYPSVKHFENIKKYITEKYICIAPASVWFTKQFQKDKWIEFIQKIDSSLTIYLLGGKSEHEFCENIRIESNNKNCINLSGKLSMLESASLMENAMMNYVNDSGPMHIASAMNANVAAIYCSTLPSFGFDPLSDKKFIIETPENLNCRPCGLHGLKNCPEKHFKCASTININELLKLI